jgi:hypothetical protein
MSAITVDGTTIAYIGPVNVPRQSEHPLILKCISILVHVEYIRYGLSKSRRAIVVGMFWSFYLKDLSIKPIC